MLIYGWISIVLILIFIYIAGFSVGAVLQRVFLIGLPFQSSGLIFLFINIGHDIPGYEQAFAAPITEWIIVFISASLTAIFIFACGYISGKTYNKRRIKA